MKLLLSGYYGFDNVGDEAVLAVIIQEVRRRSPGVEITVLSAAPQKTAELHHVDAIYRYDGLKVLSEMRKADVFLSGGGTLFQDATSKRSFWYYMGLLLLAKMLNKKTVVFAQGFGPLRNWFNQKAAGFVLKRADLITLRDEESFCQLLQIGVKNPRMHVTGDPALLLKVPQKSEGEKILRLEGVPAGKKLLGVSVRSFPHRPGREEKFFPVLAMVLDEVVSKYDYHPLFLLFQCPEDLRQASRVSNLMKNQSSIVFRVCKPREMLSLISGLDVLIGMRLHSLIFAAMSGVPMLGLIYDPKVEAFMETIDQPCVRVNKEVTAAALKEAVEKVISNKESIKNDLGAKAQLLLDQAALNFELLYQYCLKSD